MTFNVTFADLAGNVNSSATLTTTADASGVRVDVTPPTAVASISSSNAVPSLAKAGDTVTLRINASEAIQQPVCAPFVSGGAVAAGAITYGGGGSNWTCAYVVGASDTGAVSYTHLRAHETGAYLVCRLLLEKKMPKPDKLVVAQSNVQPPYPN